MVKTPRTRHSETAREPVTIDLQPGEVSRVKAEAEKAQAGKANKADKPDTPAQEAQEPAASAKEAAAEPSKTQDPRPSGSEPKQAEKQGGASSAGGPAFGRGDPPRQPPREPVDPPAAPAPHSRGGALSAGMAGGLIALLAAGGGLWVAGLLPGVDTQVRDPAPAIAALEAQIEDMRGEVAGLRVEGGGGEALAGRITQSEERVNALASGLEALRGEVLESGGERTVADFGPLEARVEALETTLAEGAGGETAASSQAVLAALEERLAPLHDDISALREEIGAMREAHDTALGRLGVLETTLQQLSARVDEQAKAPATAAIIAISALKAAIDRGASFSSELQTWASLAPDAPQIESLRAFAAEGVATRAELAAQADAAANAMIAAARPVDPDAGMLDKLWGSAMGLVRVRPIGMVEGNGVPEIVARIDAAVTAGDYERAMAEFDTLPQAAQAAGEPFMARLRARHEADRLIGEALAAALKS